MLNLEDRGPHYPLTFVGLKTTHLWDLNLQLSSGRPPRPVSRPRLRIGAEAIGASEGPRLDALRHVLTTDVRGPARDRRATTRTRDGRGSGGAWEGSMRCQVRGSLGGGVMVINQPRPIRGGLRKVALNDIERFGRVLVP